MTKTFETRKCGRKRRKARRDGWFESVDLAARPQCTVLRPNKARQFIHDLWQIRCNYHIKGSVWGRRQPASMALHYRGERTKGIAVRAEDSPRTRSSSKGKEKRRMGRVLICHRPPGPFRILDQRESYANPSRSTLIHQQPPEFEARCSMSSIDSNRQDLSLMGAV